MPLETRLDARRCAQLARQFGLDIVAAERIHAGVDNTTFVIRTRTAAFALTVLEKKTVEAARLYARYLVALAGRGLPLPSLERTVSGDWVAELGGKPAILCAFVHGTQFAILPVTHLPTLGAIFAALHTSATECGIRPFIRFDQAKLDHIPALDDRPFARWLLARHAESARRRYSDDRLVPTHGDPFPDNLILDTSGRLVLLDWEDGSTDSARIDLAMAILGQCCPEDVFSPDRLNRILHGYRDAGGMLPPGDDLLSTTVYAAAFTAYRRYVKQADAIGTVPGLRAYRTMPVVVESVMDGWRDVEL